MAHPKKIKPASNTIQSHEQQHERYETDGQWQQDYLGRGDEQNTAGFETDEDPGRTEGGPHYDNTPNPTNKKNTRANIKIATLNMQGRGANSIFDANNKWHTMNSYIRDNKIGIMCLQETHLSPEQTNEINNNLHNLTVFSTSPGETQNNAQGVAIVLNKRLINTKETKTTVLIPGRALLLETKWHNNEKLSILGIYAPNEMRENKELWENLRTIWQNAPNRPKPDIMLGDFNMTEDTADRCNGRQDPRSTIEALSDLKATLNLIDSWRQSFPQEISYTLLHRSNGHQSRIDRIYTSLEIMDLAEDWETNFSPVTSDHSVVSVKISHRNAPYLGKGRWAIPPHVIGDKRFIKTIEKQAIPLQEEIRELHTGANIRTNFYNPQTIWKKLKKIIKKEAQDLAKKPISFLDRRARELDLQLNLINNDPTLEDEERKLSATLITSERREIEEKRQLARKQTTNAKFRLEGETISKYWVNLNKEKKPRDTIYKLKKPSLPNQQPMFATRSDDMATLARDYHDELQNDDIPQTETERKRHIDNTLNTELPKLSNYSKSKLAERLDKLETSMALASASNGKAAGLDGIPYELWKTLKERHTNLKKENRESFDILDTLTIVFNDIEKHGITPNTKFNEGWMCPIHKKNEKHEISNYRPITALNTDYKLMTKALQAKLAIAAPEIINRDQAGFMKGRSIFDQIKTIQLITEYAELTEEINGAIVALDQEKAYDKIKHDYLWETLKKMNLPTNLINTIKTLYTNAETRVIINGEISPPFTVRRGVRQGDPLSCLLFNLAIEPLAEAIRSANITGIKIPKLREHLKVLLFADDTTVFLQDQDDYTTLTNTLDKWCLASGAKFNKDKTEFIPLGTNEYKTEVRETRKLNPENTPIPNGIRINKEGELVRILGAWFGNKNAEQPWTTIIDKTQTQLNRWKKSNPTIEGTRLINQMETGGRTQFLAKAQGMPTHIETRIQKIIKNFTWDNERAPINMEKMAQTLERGGRKVLDIKKRNLAIAATNIQSYLRLDETRPKWAFITDEIFRRAYDKNTALSDDDPRINPFIQKWPTPKAIKSLTRSAKEIYKLSTKLRVKIEVDEIEESLKNDMPIWLHPGIKPDKRQLTFTNGCRHLRINHNIQNVKQTLHLANTYIPDNHQPTSECECASCLHLERNYNCTNPHACIDLAQSLIQKLEKKWIPQSIPPFNEEDDPWLTNQRELARDETQNLYVTHKSNRTSKMKDLFRILTLKNHEHTEAQHRPTSNTAKEETVFTDGGCTKNGTKEARAGSGIFFATNDPRNTAERVPGDNQSNQTGEIFAAIRAIELTDTETNLQITSDSKYTIQGLTTHLQKWEDMGWIGIKNSDWLTVAADKIRNHKGNITFKWTKGHANNTGNNEADKLATMSLPKPKPHYTKPKIKYKTTGAKLSTITQALIYKALIEESPSPETKHETKNLDKIEDDAQDRYGTSPKRDAIWKNLKQNRNIFRTQREFIFKTTKNIQKVGNFWKKIPNYEHRAICDHCTQEESMEHILTTCTIPGQNEAWQLAGNLWNEKYQDWEKPLFGNILGCASQTFDKDDGLPDTGKTRLHQILISETAYLIWTLRCTRVIEHENNVNNWPSKRSIKTQLENKLNLRLRMDRLQSNEKRFKTKATPSNRVRATWSKIIEYEDERNKADWINNPGVLVGIRLKYNNETLTNR